MYPFTQFFGGILPPAKILTFLAVKIVTDEIQELFVVVKSVLLIWLQLRSINMQPVGTQSPILYPVSVFFFAQKN